MGVALGAEVAGMRLGLGGWCACVCTGTDRVGPCVKHSCAHATHAYAQPLTSSHSRARAQGLVAASAAVPQGLLRAPSACMLPLGGWRGPIGLALPLLLLPNSPRPPPICPSKSSLPLFPLASSPPPALPPHHAAFVPVPSLSLPLNSPSSAPPPTLPLLALLSP